MFKRALLAVIASLTLMLPAHATSVLPHDLNMIVDNATVAFQGTVLSNRTANEEHGVVTYTTFQVHEVLMGDIRTATYTIKQIGGDLPAEGIQFKAHGVPKFSTGQDVVVFLYGVSQAGFSSPVGLEQGRFNISVEDGETFVSNGHAIEELIDQPADDIAAKAKANANGGKAHKMRLDDFKQVVRARAGSRGKGSPQ